MARYIRKRLEVEAERVEGIPYEQWPEWARGTFSKVTLSSPDSKGTVVWATAIGDEFFMYFSDEEFFRDYEPVAGGS